ncbi:hypothetical protein BCV70DRAFT_203194 [Testicularia cyperi]|uniref:Uncharacterized protein n=1 Tax=Testicularia cyperi TaxID=1882483 RepID=A0A317XF52_9BASI|nr:hypothetical protein BCV70DRAFT_203194 [Testicularia cyperi]
MSDDGEASEQPELPLAPTSLIRLEPGRAVEDVDEEIFLLWTLNSRSEHEGGLGYVNHSHDSLYIAIDGKSWSAAASERELSGETIVKVFQDVTSLRTARGNTGSVIWRSTVHLAIQILQNRLFDLVSLAEARVLELGAGTGALPALIASRARSWLVTDQPELMPLIDKNVHSLSNCRTRSLDWFDFLDSPSLHQTRLRTASILEHLDGELPDLIICCDCVYNPALFPALVATLNAFTQPGHSMVLMACEMRSNESLSDFLRTWLESDSAWRMVSLEDRFDKGFTAFAAWKAES